MGRPQALGWTDRHRPGVDGGTARMMFVEVALDHLQIAGVGPEEEIGDRSDPRDQPDDRIPAEPEVRTGHAEGFVEQALEGAERAQGAIVIERRGLLIHC